MEHGLSAYPVDHNTPSKPHNTPRGTLKEDAAWSIEFITKTQN